MVKLNLRFVGTFSLFVVSMGACLAAEGLKFERLGRAQVMSGKLHLKIAPEVKQASKEALQQSGFAFVTDRGLAKAELWSFDEETSVAEAVDAVRKIPGVIGWSPVFLYHQYANIKPPTDKDYKEQYSLPTMDVPEAWEFAGDVPSVTVAVIDTGADMDHPDLADRIHPDSYDFVGPSFQYPFPDDDPEDYRGHGTGVSAVIGARRNGGGDVAGIVQNISLLVLKVSDDNPNGRSLSGSAIMEALDYSIDHGAKVINASFGTYDIDHVFQEAVQKLQDHGILLVAAAGNEAVSNELFRNSPCGFPLANVLSVCSTDRDDFLALFTNFGQESVDLASPGVGVWSANKQGKYKGWDGTSFSCPNVAGIAALVRSMYPEQENAYTEDDNISLRELRLMIMEGADPVESLKGKCVTEGRADAYKACSVPLPRTVQRSSDVFNPPISIPDDDEDGVQDQLYVPDDVIIRDIAVMVYCEHERIEDLLITITSPDSKEVVLMEPAGDVLWQSSQWPVDQPYVFDTHWAYRGKYSTGTWTITVKDIGNPQGSTTTGTLNQWGLEIYTYRSSASDKIGGGLLVTRSSGNAQTPVETQQVVVENCIFWGNSAEAGPQVAIAPSTHPSKLVVKFTDMEGGQEDVMIDVGGPGEEDDCVLVWGPGNIDEDPLFADDSSDDYHLKSTVGRWDPVSEGWVTDGVHSPCIDAGDRNIRPVYEPDPAGFRVNLGAYGDTEWASKTRTWLLYGDVDGDCWVTLHDLTLARDHLGLSPSSGDNWKYNINGDGSINILDLILIRNALDTSCGE